MERKMAEINRSIMLKNIALNLKHLRVTNSTASDSESCSSQGGPPPVRRSSILTEPHLQLIQQHEQQLHYQQQGQRPPVQPTDKPPYPQNQSPYPQNQSPYPQNQSPYPQNQSPYPQNQSPYPQNQPPYPQNQPHSQSPTPGLNSPKFNRMNSPTNQIIVSGGMVGPSPMLGPGQPMQMGSPLLLRKSQQIPPPKVSLNQKQIPPQHQNGGMCPMGGNGSAPVRATTPTQQQVQLSQHLSSLMVNPTAHKQIDHGMLHKQSPTGGLVSQQPVQDPNRLTQDLYNMGFRHEVAAHAAQQHAAQHTATNAEEIARMLIQQKARNSAANLMSMYGSLDNVNGELDYDSLEGCGVEAMSSASSDAHNSRSQSPAVRSNSPAYRASSRPPSPKPSRASAFRPPSPADNMKNYNVSNTNMLACRSSQIPYLKYPQPAQPTRRDYDPQHLPPRSGPMMGFPQCLPHYQDTMSDYEEAMLTQDYFKSASPPPQEYFKSASPHMMSREMMSRDAMSQARDLISQSRDMMSQSRDITSPQREYFRSASPPPMYSSNTSLHNPNVSANPQQGDLPPYDFVPISSAQHTPHPQSVFLPREDSPVAMSTSESTISVQERVKKLNQNIAIHNESYQNAMLSPKPIKKTTSTSATSKPPKLKKNKKHSEGEDKPKTPFKIFSPIPRRKAKPQTPATKPDRERTSQPAVPSEAVKFILEQRIENLIKETANKKKRREEFEESIAAYPEAEKENLKKIFAQKESDFLRLKRTKINKDMFTKIQTIGIGSFGEVTLVQKQDTGTLYAMKTLRKAEVWKRNQTAHVKAERDILSEADNEWVVKLHFSFQDKDNLYFVMDYIPGGDMMSLLIKAGKFPEWVACFYIAEIICAVESVHKLGFIHRDIKPDNILIDAKGHLKLTDFGLCTGFRWTHDSSRYHSNPHNRQASIEFDESLWTKMQQNCQCGDRYNHLKPLDRRRAHQRCLAHSLVGTPNYIAPEVLLRGGYNFECDWWSVGVIFFEMVIGRPPFVAQTPADTQYYITNWRSYLSIPVCANIGSSSISLIWGLLQDSDKRLGKGGSQELKQHQFFNDIDWNNLHDVAAPFVPELKFATDTRYFDSFDEDRVRFSDTEEQDNDTPAHPFYEFTFRRFSNGPDITKEAEEEQERQNKGPVLV